MKIEDKKQLIKHFNKKVSDLTKIEKEAVMDEMIDDYLSVRVGGSNEETLKYLKDK